METRIVDAAGNGITLAQGEAGSLFSALPANPTAPGDFDWSPAVGSAARTGGMSQFGGALAARAGSVVTPTTYRGAVDPNGPKWWQGWTNYAVN